VGAIAGAYYGLDESPPEWLRKLDPDVRSELTVLSDQLVDRSPLANNQPVTVFPPGKQGAPLG
jgi:hypothetical protein